MTIVSWGNVWSANGIFKSEVNMFLINVHPCSGYFFSFILGKSEDFRNKNPDMSARMILLTNATVRLDS